MINQNWVSQNEKWIEAQKVAIKILENSIEHEQKSIELSKANIELMKAQINHAEIGIKEALCNHETHLKENVQEAESFYDMWPHITIKGEDLVIALKRAIGRQGCNS